MLILSPPLCLACAPRLIHPGGKRRVILELDVEVFYVIPQPFLKCRAYYFWFDIVYEAFMVHELYTVCIELVAESSWKNHVDPLSSILFSLGRSHHPNRKKSFCVS